MSLVLNGTDGVTFNDSSLQGAAASPYVLKNRIINGAMVIDQRNAGASVTPTSGQYTLDRYVSVLSQASKFTVQQNAGSVTPPAGFTNYLGVTSTSAYSVGTNDFFQIVQTIEGFNIADLGWGTANARTVTLSFWVRSSLTGTFAGCLENASNTRSYVFNYTISSANTWEQKTITVAGDTTGTWVTNNGLGINLRFSLGGGATYQTTAGAWTAGDYFTSSSATSVVGTNGATFYITGVQLEQNTSATPFERRLYNQELANCQRYFETITSVGGSSPYVNFANGGANASTTARFVLPFKIQKRTYPSISFTTASGFSAQNGTDGLVACTSLIAEHISEGIAQITATVASGLTAGNCSRLISNNSNTSTISISAEL